MILSLKMDTSTPFYEDSDYEDVNKNIIKIIKSRAKSFENEYRKEDLQKLKTVEKQLADLCSDVSEEESDDSSINDELDDPSSHNLKVFDDLLDHINSGAYKDEDKKNKRFIFEGSSRDNNKICNKEALSDGKLYSIEDYAFDCANGILSREEDSGIEPDAVDFLKLGRDMGFVRYNACFKDIIVEGPLSAQTSDNDKKISNGFNISSASLSDESAPNAESSVKLAFSRDPRALQNQDMHGFMYDDDTNYTRRVMNEVLANLRLSGSLEESELPHMCSTLQQSNLRIKDERRKQARLRRKERKAAEKVRLLNEARQLQAVKKKEILDKLQKIREISGQEQLAFTEVDLDADFDPDVHDMKMAEAFGDDYYDMEDAVEPVFEYDEAIDGDRVYCEDEEELELSNPDQGESSKSAECCTESVIEGPQAEASTLLKTSRRRKRGRRGRNAFFDVIEQKKLTFDASKHDFDQYVDEYYGCHFEDAIAGGEIKCRFKYRTVEPNTFGLSTEEIMTATDAELNSWYSLNKLLRTDRSIEQEQRERKVYRIKAENFQFKKKKLRSVYEAPEEYETTSSTTREDARAQKAEEEKRKWKNLKKKVKRKQKEAKLGSEAQSTVLDEEEPPTKKVKLSTNTPKIRKKHKNDKKPFKLGEKISATDQHRLTVGDAYNTVLQLSEGRLAAYNIPGLSRIKKEARYQQKKKIFERVSHERCSKNSKRKRKTNCSDVNIAGNHKRKSTFIMP